MDEMLDGIISEEILTSEGDNECEQRETTDEEVNYGEEQSNCIGEGEHLYDSEDKLEGMDECACREDTRSSATEDEERGEDDKKVPREEDTHSHQSAEDISGDEALRVLKREIDELKRQLSERDREFERMTRECAEFGELYPDVPLRSLPDSVWDGVKNGVPIAASYALYEKKRAAEARRAAKLNEQNSSYSVGSAGDFSDDSYFSPSEVRRMSPLEVKKNYTKILESMRRWN